MGIISHRMATRGATVSKPSRPPSPPVAAESHICVQNDGLLVKKGGKRHVLRGCFNNYRSGWPVALETGAAANLVRLGW